mgnify:CR=1 FL=1
MAFSSLLWRVFVALHRLSVWDPVGHSDNAWNCFPEGFKWDIFNKFQTLCEYRVFQQVLDIKQKICLTKDEKFVKVCLHSGKLTIFLWQKISKFQFHEFEIFEKKFHSKLVGTPCTSKPYCWQFRHKKDEIFRASFGNAIEIKHILEHNWWFWYFSCGFPYFDDFILLLISKWLEIMLG